MFILTKENITEYLRGKMPELDYSKPLIMSAIGEGTEEEDGDGYINFVFRVSDGKKKIILKQARSEGRVAALTNMSLERTSIEYDHMKIGRAIVPEYFPELYFYDEENYIFAVQDISHLKISRFQLNKSIIFPDLGRHIGTYLGKMHFYTSDYYLDTAVYRDLQIRFSNHKMREVFDTQAFANREPGSEGLGFDLAEAYAPYVRDLVFDPKIVLERFKLRDLYMRKAEVLLHADFHTSNIFIDQNEMKVIDMEYTFLGPAAYDLGYIESHLLSQYVCAAFRPFDTEEERSRFMSYMLATMQQVFDVYCEVFFASWDKDAKAIYKNVPGLKEHVKESLLKDMIGFCSTSNMFRTAGCINYPEYDDLTDPEANRNAAVLSVIMDHQMMIKREAYENVTEWIDDLIGMLKEFKSRI